MASATLRKSITDLTRRKARAVFAVLTLAIAVASVGIFAAPSLMNTAMQKEVQTNKLPDLTLSTKPLALTPSQLAALSQLPNVTAAGGFSYFQTRVWVGERRLKALVVGIPVWTRQQVDVVSLVSGVPPTSGSVLTDIQNEKQGRYSGTAGDTIRILGIGDRTLTVPLSGVARNLMIGGQQAAANNLVVLYSTPALITRLGGDPGFSSLEFRLRETGTAAADRTVARIKTYLTANTSFKGFSDLPAIRKAGTYPGKDFFDQLASLMNVFTVLALLSALVLIANTMTTLIGEQRREIGMMKAIGGTRRQIRRIYLRTALLLGAIGSLIGVGLGVVIANAIVRYFGSSFFAITPGFGVVVPVIVASVVLGLAAPPLAALPAIRPGAGRGSMSAKGSRRCPRSRVARRCSTVPCAGSASCRGQRRSASAASPVARDAASPRSSRSASRSGHCLRCSHSSTASQRRRTRSGTVRTSTCS
jgi:putative ABC transport system permease protein